MQSPRESQPGTETGHRRGSRRGSAYLDGVGQSRQELLAFSGGVRTSNVPLGRERARHSGEGHGKRERRDRSLFRQWHNLGTISASKRPFLFKGETPQVIVLQESGGGGIRTHVGLRPPVFRAQRPCTYKYRLVRTSTHAKRMHDRPRRMRTAAHAQMSIRGGLSGGLLVGPPPDDRRGPRPSRPVP